LATLLADIGGTHARFALLEGTAPGPPLVLPVAGFPTLEDALAEALARIAPGGVARALLAVAAPVEGGTARLTNAAWEASAPALTARFGIGRVRLVNDFLALAHALPRLGPADLHPIGGGAAAPGAPMLVLGPGTGLGMAGFLPGPGIAVPTEGGHAGLAGADPREYRIIAALRTATGRAGAEEALSGRGLARLHALLAAEAGASLPARDAAAVVAAAGTCPVAAGAVALFLDLLAGFAGDMALAWGARGGVFLGGGILPRLLDRLEPARFRARFEDKPPMRDYLAGLPVAVIGHPAPAFLGLAALAAAD
jgi:glucokinase